MNLLDLSHLQLPEASIVKKHQSFLRLKGLYTRAHSVLCHTLQIDDEQHACIKVKVPRSSGWFFNNSPKANSSAPGF
jgi:hypothetical protein